MNHVSETLRACEAMIERAHRKSLEEEKMIRKQSRQQREIKYKPRLIMTPAAIEAGINLRMRGATYADIATLIGCSEQCVRMNIGKKLNKK